MNYRFKRELDKVKCVALTYDDNTTHLFIPKINSIKLEVDNCYLIKLSENVVNPPSNSTLASNWNNGSVPKHYYYKVDISKIMGTMIKINGVAFDNVNQKDINELWCGWIPKNEIEIIKKL